jgi:hypothetical protein
MGLLEIIDQTFRLYRGSFWLFFGIAAAVFVPLGVLQIVPIIGALGFMVAYIVVQGALTKAVSDRYLGRDLTLGDAYRYVFRRFWPFVATLIVAGIFVFSGALLLGIGMIVFGFWAAFVVQVFIIEDRRYLDAVWRGRYLVGQGVWAELLVLLIVVGFLAFVIQTAALVISVSLMGLLAAAMGDEIGGLFWLVFIPFGLVTGLVQSLVFPLTLVATVLLYYDSRIRKEGFDLEVLAREMGSGPPPTAAPDTHDRESI